MAGFKLSWTPNGLPLNGNSRTCYSRTWTVQLLGNAARSFKWTTALYYQVALSTMKPTKRCHQREPHASEIR